MEQDQDQDDSLKKEQCGGYQGCHTPAAPFLLGSALSFFSPVVLVPLGAQGTIMLLLSQGRTPWFPNCGVVQTQQNMGVYSGHADLSANFSPIFSAFYLPLLLLLTLAPPPAPPAHFCLLCPGHGSGHKDTPCDFPAELLGSAAVGRGDPRHGGITGTRCHSGSTEAAQEMTGIPIFPGGTDDEWEECGCFPHDFQASR